jgi:hypothetical protein
MRTHIKIKAKAAVLIVAMAVITAASTRLQAQTGCTPNPTPFTDLGGMPSVFCQAVAEAYFSGLTSGTTPTTYSPSMNVTRDQMAAFITRTLDQSLKRGNRRAALDQWAMPPTIPATCKTTVGNSPVLVKSDGTDLWVTNYASHSVSRIRACDGKLLGTWTGANFAFGVLVARGRIYVTGQGDPAHLYEIDPSGAPGPVTTIATIGNSPTGLTTDGFFVWTANYGSVSKVNPVTGAVSNYTITGSNRGILYDGANIWVANLSCDCLYKLSSSGVILDTVPVGASPYFPVFDGMNIWVPNYGGNSVTVVRAVGTSATGADRVLATLTGNGLNDPAAAAFDGERILVTNFRGDSVSLWKAADLTPLWVALTGTGSYPFGACSDGINFWITLQGTDKLARF